MQAQNCSEEKKSKKADNIPLHQPVPKPVDSASPKNSLIFCSITASLSLCSDGVASKEFSEMCLQRSICILKTPAKSLTRYGIGEIETAMFSVVKYLNMEGQISLEANVRYAAQPRH